MNIKPTYVTFEQAKLLKEKGLKGIEIDYGLNQMLNNCKTPEQWQVIEWLRTEKSIWIGVNRKFNRFYSVIYTNSMQHFDYIVCDTPQEAYSAAFDYILKQKDL